MSLCSQKDVAIPNTFIPFSERKGDSGENILKGRSFVCPSQSDFSIDYVACWIGEHRINKLTIGNQGRGIRI